MVVVAGGVFELLSDTGVAPVLLGAGYRSAMA